MQALVDLLGWGDLTPQEQAVVLVGAARGAVIGFVCWLVCGSCSAAAAVREEV